VSDAGTSKSLLYGQVSLLTSDEWNDYVTETGLIVEVSALDVHAQNGAASKSGGGRD